MSKLFTKVPQQRHKFNTFDLSHDVKFTASAGMITPCFIAETIPNDTFRISTSQLVRMAPMLAPLMHQISVYTHFFYVPNRILWSNWETFINGGKDGEQTPVFPFVNVNNTWTGPHSIADYFGIPEIATTTPVAVNALPFAAYHKIWWEFYRDQNLYVPTGNEETWLDADSPLSDGDNGTNTNIRTRRFRAWQHDYFTSALPWTQRGPEATIPLGVSADLSGTGDLTFDPDSAASSRIMRVDNTAFAANDVTYPASSGLDNDAQITVIGEPAQIDVTGHTFVDPTGLQVDLSTATAASINDLRRAFRLQEWLEINARSGARYNEAIMAHFGINPGDGRIQRPIFLGGAATKIQMSEVLQTSSTDATTPQANMAGHGISMGGKNVVNYKCREHGFIIGLMTIMPKSAYQQGLTKFWTKFDKFDYFWKQFANIGEQAIYNKEVFLDPDDGEDNTVFGYTPRYSEYKYINDRVAGEFKDTLDFWHAGRIFATRPLLNNTFVTMAPAEIARIFTVVSTGEQQFYVYQHHEVKAKRIMPFFGVPTI